MPVKFGPHLIHTSQIFFTSQFSFGLVNLKPITTGHVLVVPKRNVPRLAELTTDEVSDLFVSAQQIGKVIEREFDGTSLTVAMQDGPAAGQTVAHCHVHVIPRRFGDWKINDDIYEELDHTKIDNEERPPRTKEEMAHEAEWLRPFFGDQGVPWDGY